MGNGMGAPRLYNRPHVINKCEIQQWITENWINKGVVEGYSLVCHSWILEKFWSLKKIRENSRKGGNLKKYVKKIR